MAYPTVTERPGALSGTGFAKEGTFGTPLTATTFLPMMSNTLEVDPGWFSPHVMQGQRDLQVYNLYGEAKYGGSINGPLFPSNAMALLVASIGTDAVAGSGVTGSAGTGSTTMSGTVTAGASTITVASASGFTTGQVVQIDVNGTGPTTTAECRKITVSGTTFTLDQPLVYGHSSGAAVVGVVAPYTHTVSQSNTLSSLTVEKNLGGFQSLQFAGCRVNKLDIKAPVGNNPIDLTADVIGQSAAVLNSPTPITITNELPFVFAEATLTPFGQARNDVSNVQVSIENGLKETRTYSGLHGPSFITPTTLHVTGTFDAVWSSLTDSTYGDYNRMVNGSLGTLVLTVQHPASAGTVTITMPQVAYSKYANDIKMEDAIMSQMTFEASRPLSGASQYTVQATVINNVYLAY
jgi:hypothetical protein